MGGFRQRLLRQLRQRIDQVLGKFHVDAVTDTGAADHVDESDVLIDGYPVEQVALDLGSVVAALRG